MAPTPCGTLSAKSGPMFWPALRSAPASTDTSPRTSWLQSWARAPGGRCRSRCHRRAACIRTRPASFPIVQALLGKGAALGTVLAFMMSVIGLSLPETIILRKVLRPQLIAVFMGVVAVGILIVGYLFNIIL